MKAAVCLITGLFLIACSTMESRYSEKGCAEADWQELGMSWALKGKTLNEGFLYFEKHCSGSYGVAVVRRQFDLGFQQGLKDFCTFESGMKFGSIMGRRYKNTCPPNQELSFRMGYDEGLRLFDHQTRILNQTIIQQSDRLQSDVSGSLPDPIIMSPVM